MRLLLIIIILILALFVLMRLYARSGSIQQSYPPGYTAGLTDGKLAPCKSSPNCISSQCDPLDRMHYAPAMQIPVTIANPKQRLIEVITSMPGAQIIEDTDQYIRAEYTTKLMRYVDDVEFLVDEKTRTIHFRSASRVGYSDMNLNRKRIEEIRALMNAQ